MKNALVTGVSWTTGIGFAITKQLIKDGYYVYAVYHNNESTAKKYFEKNPKNIEMIQCDLAKRDALKKLIDRLSGVSLNAIVNNAGVFNCKEKINEYDMNIWDDAFAVNVNAPLILSICLKPNLQKDAVIVNMVSTDGQKGSFSSIAYAASKAALINLTDSLAINFGYDEKKIRVTAVCPGIVKTNETMVPPVTHCTFSQLCPLERPASPKEIANVVSFLVSDKASFISGGLVPVHGGYNAVSFDMLVESGRKFDGYHPEEVKKNFEQKNKQK